MKVLLVNGSPHKNGATARALQEVGTALQDNGVQVDDFWIGIDPIAGCIGCGACRKAGGDGTCFRKDIVCDMVAKMEEYDGFVFGSPVHYAAISGAMTSFMDRAFFAGSDKMFLKPAATVVSCRRGGASAAFDQLNKYPTFAGMLLVGSNYWNQVHGGNGADVEQDEEGLQTMRMLGKNMAYALQCLQAGKQAGVVAPVPEKKIKTNYIR